MKLKSCLQNVCSAPTVVESTFRQWETDPQYWLLSILVSLFQKDFSTETETVMVLQRYKDMQLEGSVVSDSLLLIVNVKMS